MRLADPAVRKHSRIDMFTCHADGFVFILGTFCGAPMHPPLDSAYPASRHAGNDHAARADELLRSSDRHSAHVVGNIPGLVFTTRAPRLMAKLLAKRLDGAKE